MHTNIITDADLWQAIKFSDKQAFESLFERYWQSIYTTAYSYLKDHEVCSEIAHDIFLGVWQKRELLEIISFKSYFTMAARYMVYKELKKRRASKLSYVEDYKSLPLFETKENEGDEKIRYLELRLHIDKLLHELPQRCREIFIMSRMQNLTNTEIADRLSISKRTVENQITIAVKHLRVCLKHIAIIIMVYYFPNHSKSQLSISNNQTSRFVIYSLKKINNTANDLLEGQKNSITSHFDHKNASI